MEGYAAFCQSLDSALNTVADQMLTRPEQDGAADAAIHFALLSYAAGLASDRYLSLLRTEKNARQEAEAPNARKKKAEKKGG